MPLPHFKTGHSSARLERSFLRLWIASLTLAAATILLLDPLAQLGTGLLPPMTPNTRADRAERATTASTRPDCVVLGSSRIMGIEPEQLEQLLPAGTRCENAGVFTATIEDIEVQYGLWAGERSPRWVFVGVEQRMFHPTIAADESLTLDARLRRQMDPSPTRRAIVETWLSAIFGPDTFEAALRSVAVRMQPPTEPRFTMTGRGALHWTRWENQIQQTGRAPEFLLEQNVQAWIGWHSGFHVGSPERLHRWQSWLQRLAGSGVQIVVFLPPEDARLRRRVFDAVSGAEATERQWIRRVGQDVELAGGTLLDLRSLPDVDNRPELPPSFYDGIHPRPELVQRMTQVLAETVH